MTRIQNIAAKFPNVGLALSDKAEAVRGQLSAIGFNCRDENAEGIDWVVADEGVDAVAARHPGIPVLSTKSKVSVFVLEQAIIALLDAKAA